MTKSILIVDDEAPIRNLLTRYLIDAGYECFQAENAEKAKTALAERSFDLLLSDLNMPGETGLDLIRYAKIRFPEMGRVMVTAFSSQKIASEIMDVGVYGYIIKPFSKEMVIIAVENALRHLRLNLHLQAYKRELEKNISLKTEKLTAVMNNLSVGVIMIDRNMHVVEFNSRMLHFFPNLSQRAANFCHKIFNTPPDENISECFPIVETFETGKTTEVTRIIETPQGERDFRIIASPVINSSGEIYSGILLFEDITEKLLLEKDLRNSQKLETVGQLAAGIAHEINTPAQYVGDNIHFVKNSFGDLGKLMDICSFWLKSHEQGTLSAEMHQKLAEEIRNADLDFLSEEMPAALDQSIEGIGRIERIVRAMKAFSHPGDEDKNNSDINKILETTITVSRNEWKYVTEMYKDFSSDLPLVPCYAGELSQAFLNIIVNSAHAISDALEKTGEKLGKISILTRKIDDSVEIRIRDTGGGIPEAIQDRIFEPFFTTKVRGKGTGQGLAIAHRVIVDRHQGELCFEVEKDKGTTFVIKLPVNDAKNL